MNNRRNFLKHLIKGGAVLSLSGSVSNLYAEDLLETFDAIKNGSIDQLVEDEDIWKRVQAAYTVSKSVINFNNGGVAPQPQVVLEAERKYLGLINELPSYHLLRRIPKNRTFLKEKLAKIAGCDGNELAIVQNATEAINTIMLGIDWQEGDEIVLSTQDYSTVKVGFEQLARRRKVKLIWVQLPVPAEDDKSIINAYCSKFNKRTKLVVLTHMTNWTGQLIPNDVLLKICKKARELSIFSLIDGAHAFAQVDFNLHKIQCDAYATSLHKWLSAPIGMGMLYVRHDKIADIWSLYPSSKQTSNNISKFENAGTISLAKEEATHYAIEFFHNIGIQLKEARLRYLKNYWMSGLGEYKRIKFFTSQKDRYSCAIGLFDVIGANFREVANLLEKKYQIHNTVSKFDDIRGVRISPNVYTQKDDLDKFLVCMGKIMEEL